MLITIDPGEQTGWALWSPSGILYSCGLGSPSFASGIVGAVIEYPVIYPRSKARPADILKLAQIAAEYGGVYKYLMRSVLYVEPAEWKGQTPKDIHHMRIWNKLQSLEQVKVDLGCKGLPASKRHNVIDAVGLGLWHYKRLPR